MAAHVDVPDGSVVRIGQAFRRTIIWQAATSMLMAILSGWFAGLHGVVSATLGGGIGIAGVLVFALFSRRSNGDSRNTMRMVLRAEAAKVSAVVVLLWLVFVAYHGMVVLAFLGAFVVSVLLSGLAFAVSGDQLNSSKV